MTSAEKHGEAAQYSSDRRHEAAQKRRENQTLPALVPAYESGDMAVSLEIAGYLRTRQDRVECPAKYLCLTYQRNPKKRALTPAPRWRVAKPGHRCHVGCCLKYVQVPVFVDVVEVSDPAEVSSDIPVLVIPSVVRLEPSDRPTLRVGEVFDLTPLGGVGSPTVTSVGFAVEDGERGPQITRELVPEALNVQFVDEMVERAPKVEQTVSDQKRPVLGVEFLGIDVEAVFESVSVSFVGGAVALRPPKRVPTRDSKFVPERFEMALGPPPFGPGPGPLPAHALTSSSVTEKPQEPLTDWEDEGGTSVPEPKQKTPKGLEIPVPTRESVFSALRNAIKPVKKP